MKTDDADVFVHCLRVAAAPGFDPSKFWEVVTYSASEEAGAAPGCVHAVRKTFKALHHMSKDAAGKQELAGKHDITEQHTHAHTQAYVMRTEHTHRQESQATIKQTYV